MDLPFRLQCLPGCMGPPAVLHRAFPSLSLGLKYTTEADPCLSKAEEEPLDLLALEGVGGEESGPFDGAARDAVALGYPGQPREKNGRFAEGKILTGGSETGTLQSSPSVKLPDGRETRLTPGTKITKIHTFAGEGTKKPIRDVKRLENTYRIPANEWKKRAEKVLLKQKMALSTPKFIGMNQTHREE